MNDGAAPVNEDKLGRVELSLSLRMDLSTFGQ